MEQQQNNKRRHFHNPTDFAGEEFEPPRKRLNNNQTVKRCWVCYEPSVDTGCSKCQRYAHERCLESRPAIPCVNAYLVPNSSQIGYNINKMLRIIVEKWLKFDERLDSLEGVSSVEIENWKKHFNYQIKRRTEQSQYLSTNQFAIDIQDLVFEIVATLADKMRIPFHKLKKWADTTVNCVKDKISLLELCSECFVNMSNNSVNWFTNFCGRRHEIVWAKPHENVYWPAKVLKKGDKRISVQFFGTYEIKNIASTNIIEYSSAQNPNDLLAEEDSQRMETYVEEVKRYQKKLVQETSTNNISNKFTIAINQYENHLVASQQALLALKSARNEDLEAYQVQLQKLMGEKDYLSDLNKAYIEKIELLSKKSEECIAQRNHLAAQNDQLILENNRLVTQKAQLTAEISEMETNNEELTKALIKADMDKKESESALKQRLIQMEIEKNEAKNQREKLLNKVKKLIET